jgi:hypothetical protein
MANEPAAIGNLRSLVTALEMRRAFENAYPVSTDWATLYPPATTPAIGPPLFQTAGALSGHEVQGYRYTYTSTGGTQYAITAVPDRPGTTGTRSFYADESGMIHHCLSVVEHMAATVKDPELTEAPVPCSHRGSD